MRTRRRMSEAAVAANRANAQKQRPGGKLTKDEFEFIRSLKQWARKQAMGPLVEKTVAVICDPVKTWGDAAFEAAAHFMGDRMGLPKETVQDLKLQAGVGPTIKFEIVRPKPGE